MTWILLVAVVLAIALLIMLTKNAEEPQTRHTEPGQGKLPEQKERDRVDERGDREPIEIYES